MKRYFWFPVFALLLAVSVVGLHANTSADETALRPAQKQEWLVHAAGKVEARTYRSTSGLHKIIIPTDAVAALERAKAAGAIAIADYGSYQLFALNQASLTELEDRRDNGHQDGAFALSSEGEGQLPADDFFAAAQIHDDFNVLLLRSGVIDTTEENNFFALGKAASAFTTNQNPSSTPTAKPDFKGSRLRLVQFVGPVKDAWLDELRAAGLELIAYVPNNAYLVRENAAAAEQLSAAIQQGQSRGTAFIQWEGEFKAEYKIHPQLLSSIAQEGEVTVAVQIANSRDRSAALDVRAVQKIASSILLDAYPVLNFTNVKIKVSAKRIAELAALANVVNIEGWSAPRLFDERASQIVAGELTSDGKEPKGAGYMSWLQSKGFSSRFDFAIDVSDTGVDRGSLLAANLHPDFKDAAGQSRLLYARDYTSEFDPSDVEGHGTINLSIAGGYNVTADTRDATGYNNGLGIAPFVALGASKIFLSNGRFDLNEPYSNLIAAAYVDGARISSNSWGETRNEYTLDAQEYDTRVRDALPTQAGNQEMVICFAAGNSGVRSIGSPSSAKNVISVGASENVRKGGPDGCGVKDDSSDNALDIASFSSGGPLGDGRLKPDLCAPGTHVIGAASQSPDFNGTGVCGPDDRTFFFPKGQTLYTWSSGTSHSTPIVAGAAALVRQYLLNRSEAPNAALIKALLLNTTTYMTGERAGGNLPHPRQGWGLLNLGRLFDSTPKIFINQTQTFTDSGQEYVFTGEVKDATQPFRVTLAWTDAPGFSVFAPWTNNLDLEVVINGQTYRGNNFLGSQSKPGGDANSKDNVESVWLPVGTTGTFAVRVRATNIAGDGVPNNNDLTDQDFALVVYNGEKKDVGVVTIAGASLSAGADATADPGETVSLRLSLKDVAPLALTGARGTLTTSLPGINITTATADFANLAAGATGENTTPFVFTIDRSVTCGTVIPFTLTLEAQGSFAKLPFAITVGNLQSLEFFSDNIEAGEALWTHASAFKKKKKKVPIDPWVITTKRFHSGGNAWFAPDSDKMSDAHLDTLPITIPAGIKNLQLVFYHAFEFEAGGFDGGVLEISSGGDFEDAGAKILQGGYTGKIFTSEVNTLSGRDAWVEGRLGAFQPVIVDLSSYAGKTIVIRFRIATDPSVKAPGWYIDDVLLKGDRVTCAPVSLQ
ncbi:MAG: S8 family serine peptidase [Acidobacteria bacterium]|nr:S8 family serine peptidase [Acidobacteriota bacterium]